jgi:hypothetical protein
MRGACHCGAVILEVTLLDGFNTARRCDCSYCARRGAIVVSALLGDLEIVQGAENLTLYHWARPPNIGSVGPAGFTHIISAGPIPPSMALT